MSDSPVADQGLERERRSQAVAIAQDVLSRLEQRKLQLRPGAYFNIFKNFIYEIRKDHSAKLLSEIVDEIEPYCLVCALGACFLSKARLLGDTGPTVEYIGYPFRSELESVDQTMRKQLQVVFSTEQLFMIEAAFEQYHAGSGRDHCTDPFHKTNMANAANFCAEIDDPRARLRAIMENIISNDGVFVPCPNNVTTTEEPSNV